MRWKTDKAPFLSALSRVSKVVASNPRSVPILQCVLIESIGQDLYVIATSSSASVRVQVRDAVVGEPGRIVVSLDKLRDRVSKTTGDIVFEADSNMLRISSSTDQRLGIRLNDIREMPSLTWVDSDESYGFSTDEVSSIFRKIAGVSAKTTALTPSFLQAKISEQRVAFASGMSYHSIPVKVHPSLTARVPLSTLGYIISFISDSGYDKVWFSQNYSDTLVVSVGKDQFQATPLSIDFPNISPLFDKVDIASTQECVLDRRAFLKELRSARSTTDDSGSVSLRLAGLGMAAAIHLDVRSTVGDFYQSVVGCSWDGEDNRTLTFQIDSLISFLNAFDSDRLSFLVGSDTRGELAPIIVREGEGVGVLNQYRED